MPDPNRSADSPGPRRAAIAISVLALLALAPAVALGQALILTETTRATVAEAAVALDEVLTSLGLATEVVELYGWECDPGDLSGYRCVWDLRIDVPMLPEQVARMREYAEYGGGLFFAGEHPSFDPRNRAITDFLVSLAGGGPLTDSGIVPGTVPEDYPEAVNPAHQLATQCDAVTEIVYDGVDSGTFLDVGFGSILTRDPTTSDIGAAVWDPGDLFLAPNARVVVVLDINFLATGPTGTFDYMLDRVTPTENRIFIQNVADYLCHLECCPPGSWPPYPPVFPPAPLASPLYPAAPASPASPASPCLPGSPTSAAFLNGYNPLFAGPSATRGVLAGKPVALTGRPSGALTSEGMRKRDLPAPGSLAPHDQAPQRDLPIP